MPELGDREPFSREGEMKAAIGHAYAAAYYAQPAINTRQSTPCGGVSLHPGFVNRMDVRLAMETLVRANVMTWRQGMVLWCRFAKAKTQEDTARHLHLTRNTIAVDEVAGLQTLIRYIWRDPEYTSPPRTRRLNPTGDPLLGMQERDS